jgi:hypothetical protein
MTLNMKPTLTLLSLLLAPLAALHAADLVLVAKDTPPSPIIVFKDAPPRTRAAEVELHCEGNTYAPLDFKDFIPAAENPLAKAADGKPLGLQPEALK